MIPFLRVAVTINEGESDYKLKKTKGIEKLIKQFAPLANDAVIEDKKNIRIFLPTDAHGIRMNTWDGVIWTKRSSFSEDLSQFALPIINKAINWKKRLSKGIRSLRIYNCAWCVLNLQCTQELIKSLIVHNHLLKLWYWLWGIKL